jgi:hypothetical protein
MKLIIFLTLGQPGAPGENGEPGQPGQAGQVGTGEISTPKGECIKCPAGPAVSLL